METEKRAHIQRGPRERRGRFENGLHKPVGYKSSSGEEGEEKNSLVYQDFFLI